VQLSKEDLASIERIFPIDAAAGTRYPAAAMAFVTK
jgi:hypothetical protein